MKRIRIVDAKAHLSELISNLTPGEDVVITRHGVAVAKLTGLADSEIMVSRNAASRIRAFAKSLGAGTFTDEELVALVHEGRR
jgi:prevent-host-death family protein